MGVSSKVAPRTGAWRSVGKDRKYSEDPWLDVLFGHMDSFVLSGSERHSRGVLIWAMIDGWLASRSWLRASKKRKRPNVAKAKATGTAKPFSS